VIKITRANGTTLAKRRCSEFRQLIDTLHKEMPRIYFPELPAKKSTGSNLPLQEKRVMLQNILDCLLTLKIYNKEVHRFLQNENEVPVYLKKISKRLTKKGKIRITAVPSNSIITEPQKIQIDDDLIWPKNSINYENMKQQYTTKFIMNYNDTPQKIEPEQKITENENQSPSKIMIPVLPNLNIEELRTGLIDSMTFTARINDVKYQSNKFVFFLIILEKYYTICISCSIASNDQIVHVSYDTLKELNKQMAKKIKNSEVKLDFPKDQKLQGNSDKIQKYVTDILAKKELRSDEEVKRIFKLKTFYEQAEKDSQIYEAVNIPE